MSRRFVLVFFGVLFWTGGIFANGRPVSEKNKTDADAAVLEAVLVDLLVRPHSPVEPRWELPRGKQEETAKRLLFSTEALASSQIQGSDVFPQGARGEFWVDFAKEFQKLPAGDRSRAKEAAEHLAQRARKKENFKVFVPKNELIKMYTKEQEKQQRTIDQKTVGFGGLGPQVFRAFSPGYSKDRSVAVVSLSFGWSGNFHGARGTYVLVKRNNEWLVVVSNLILYQ